MGKSRTQYETSCPKCSHRNKVNPDQRKVKCSICGTVKRLKK